MSRLQSSMLKQYAIDETKKGGEPLNAIAYAILYLAEAVRSTKR